MNRYNKKFVFVATFVALGLFVAPISQADDDKEDKEDKKGLTHRLLKLEQAFENFRQQATREVRALEKDLAAAKTKIGKLEKQVAASDVSRLDRRVTNVEGKFACVSDVSNSMDFVFEGCNVHVRDKSGATNSTSGFGNLIVGYNGNSNALGAADRATGTHNLIVGDNHHYTSYGGVVAGFQNTISAPWATVTGGVNNMASGLLSSISGGASNTASGDRSSVSGGQTNASSGSLSSVSGGFLNTASGDRSSVSGGANNMATLPNQQLP